ncbi:copper-binding protein [Zoogloea sp.]|uniref:copper-binding protein n=1 Tax=Zoogloea sp. TaxID=49181 RepID=UPI001416DFEA|nr:MAG: copper-binding protein [Zoogloea sp.]
MKAPVLVLALCLGSIVSIPAMAASDHASHASMHGNAATAQPLTDGLVKKVDKAAGKLTLSHGPLPNGMPAMTMAFGVKDAAWLEQLKAGDKIRFAADQINGAMVVTRLERN